MSRWDSHVGEVGPNWLVDNLGRVVGYRDKNGNDYQIATQSIPGGAETITPGSQLSPGGGTTRTYRGDVASQAAMLALPAIQGDWCRRTDLSNQVFELTALPAATLANWVSYPNSGGGGGTVVGPGTVVANELVLYADTTGNNLGRANGLSGLALLAAGVVSAMTSAATKSWLALTSSDVGLGNVTNESKATMFTSPTFTGTTAAPTPTGGDNTTKIATTAYVQGELTAKAPLANPTFTGTVTLPGDPASALQAATKQYVDNLLNGLKWKTSVRVATTANGALSTAYANGQTLDGQTLSTGDRILLKDQTTGSENGIYTVNSSGAPTRAVDADAGTELVSAAVFVQQGTANADKGFVCTNDSITIGSTSITWTQFNSAAGGLVAANNLSDLGNIGTALTNLGFSTFIKTLIDDADAATARATLGAAASASPSFTGTETHAGSSILTSYTITITTNAGSVDPTKPLGNATNNADTTLSFGSTPSADTWFAADIVNSDASNSHTWTIPSSWSQSQMATITAVKLPASGRATLIWHYTGSIYELYGDPGGDRDSAEETLASAATTNIGSTLSKNVSVTGTTTITSFGTSNAGIFRRLRFTGALTLTHNASSLIIPGGANFTTAAGDRVEALSLGSGNWLVLQVVPQATSSARLLIGAATTAQVGGIPVFVETPSNKTYILVEKAPYACTLTELAGKTVSGTLTATLAINGTNVTTGALNATSTQAAVSPTALNAVAAGDRVTLVVSSNSSGADFSAVVKFSRNLA